LKQKLPRLSGVEMDAPVTTGSGPKVSAQAEPKVAGRKTSVKPAILKKKARKKARKT